MYPFGDVPSTISNEPESVYGALNVHIPEHILSNKYNIHI